MIRLFRSIRQKLMKEGKMTNYLKYAIGEILLVVIGILIALSINNWNENNKNTKREKAFFVNMLDDLKLDSIRLQEIKSILETAVRYKQFFENYMAGKQTDKDSLNAHFHKQYNILVDFIPNSTTMDELSSGNGINLISNPVLRRKIVTLYNNYDVLAIKLKTGKDKGQSIVNYVSQKVPNINDISDSEMTGLLDDRFYTNQTRMNYLITQLEAVENAFKQCLETLEWIKKEINYD